MTAGTLLFLMGAAILITPGNDGHGKDTPTRAA
jgi:hypothetical protein